MGRLLEIGLKARARELITAGDRAPMNNSVNSKRLGSPYRSGREDCWLKVKKPAAPRTGRGIRSKHRIALGVDDAARTTKVLSGIAGKRL
jgi:hypothetical protein